MEKDTVIDKTSVNTSTEDITKLNQKLKKYKFLISLIFIIVFTALLVSGVFVGIGNIVFATISLCSFLAFLKWG